MGGGAVAKAMLLCGANRRRIKIVHGRWSAVVVSSRSDPTAASAHTVTRSVPRRILNVLSEGGTRNPVLKRVARPIGTFPKSQVAGTLRTARR
eukprot:m.252502 g.252502  ORF g.252502 m.252502 type:complete len:93 (-) comp15915_c0_seq1:1585-1863(-)